MAAGYRSSDSTPVDLPASYCEFELAWRAEIQHSNHEMLALTNPTWIIPWQIERYRYQEFTRVKYQETLGGYRLLYANKTCGSSAAGDIAVFSHLAVGIWAECKRKSDRN